MKNIFVYWGNSSFKFKLPHFAELQLKYWKYARKKSRFKIFIYNEINLYILLKPQDSQFNKHSIIPQINKHIRNCKSDYHFRTKTLSFVS